jgi:hypothetical membrane protein
MKYDDKRIAGLLILVGVVQQFFASIISQAMYSGFNASQQYMSDLGDWSLAGNYAEIFNASAILMGMFIIAGAYFIQRGFKNRLFPSLLVMSGVGSVGVGVVAENISFPVHVVFAQVVFVFGAASAIMSYRFGKSFLSYIAVILGAVMLSADAFNVLGYSVSSVFYLGLGKGGIESFMILPLMLWELGFSVYLIRSSSHTATTSKA